MSFDVASKSTWIWKPRYSIVRCMKRSGWGYIWKAVYLSSGQSSGRFPMVHLFGTTLSAVFWYSQLPQTVQFQLLLTLVMCPGDPDVQKPAAARSPCGATVDGFPTSARQASQGSMSVSNASFPRFPSMSAIFSSCRSYCRSLTCGDDTLFADRRRVIFVMLEPVRPLYFLGRMPAWEHGLTLCQGSALVLIVLISGGNEARCSFSVTNFDGRDNGRVRHEDSRVALLYFRHRATCLEAMAKQLTPLLDSAVFLEHFRRDVTPMRSSKNYEPGHRGLLRDHRGILVCPRSTFWMPSVPRAFLIADQAKTAFALPWTGVRMPDQESACAGQEPGGHIRHGLFAISCEKTAKRLALP